MLNKAWLRVLGAEALITAVALAAFFALCATLFDKPGERAHASLVVFIGTAVLSFVLSLWNGPREFFIAGFVAAFSSFLAATLSVHFGFLTAVIVVGLAVLFTSPIADTAKEKQLNPWWTGLSFLGEAVAICLPMYLYF